MDSIRKFIDDHKKGITIATFGYLCYYVGYQRGIKDSIILVDKAISDLFRHTGGMR